jgi:hypothetical protein
MTSSLPHTGARTIASRTTARGSIEIGASGNRRGRTHEDRMALQTHRTRRKSSASRRTFTTQPPFYELGEYSMTKFIQHGNTLINPAHIATASPGPAKTRGGLVLRDSHGVEMGYGREGDLAGLPNFVRVGDILINLDHIKAAEKTPNGLKLRGTDGHTLATVDAPTFQAAVEAVRDREAAQ